MAQRQVVLLSCDSHIGAWDLHTGTALTQYKNNACPKGGICLLGRDYLVAAQTTKHAIHFWTWHKDQVLQRSFMVEAPTVLAASPDGGLLVAGGASGTLYLWEVPSGRLLRTWAAHYKAVSCLMFLGGSGTLVSGGEDTLVNVWLLSELLDVTVDPNSLQYTRPAPLYAWSEHTLPVTALACGAGEASAIVATASLDRSIKLHRLADGRLLRSLTLPSSLTSLALDAGEQALYVGASDGAVYEVNLLGEGSFSGTGGSASLAWAESAAAGAGPGSAVAISAGVPAGAAAAGGNAASLLDACARLEAHTRAVTCIALSPDGEMLVSGSEDGTARVWDLRSRQPVQVIATPAKTPVTGLIVAPQPAYLVPGSSAGDSATGSGSGRVGPKRPQPLAPFVKYQGMPGTLKPWEGPAVVLDGCMEFSGLACSAGICISSATSSLGQLSNPSTNLPGLVTGAVPLSLSGSGQALVVAAHGGVLQPQAMADVSGTALAALEEQNASLQAELSSLRAQLAQAESRAVQQEATVVQDQPAQDVVSQAQEQNGATPMQTESEPVAEEQEQPSGGKGSRDTRHSGDAGKAGGKKASPAPAPKSSGKAGSSPKKPQSTGKRKHS